VHAADTPGRYLSSPAAAHPAALVNIATDKIRLTQKFKKTLETLGRLGRAGGGGGRPETTLHRRSWVVSPLSDLRPMELEIVKNPYFTVESLCQSADFIVVMLIIIWLLKLLSIV